MRRYIQRVCAAITVLWLAYFFVKAFVHLVTGDWMWSLPLCLAGGGLAAIYVDFREWEARQ